MHLVSIGAIASTQSHPSLFNPFDGSITWDLAFNFSTGGTKNYGSGGNAVSGTSIPVFDSLQRAFRYRRSFSQNFKSQAAISYTTPLTIWAQFKTPSGYTGSQGIISMSNTHRFLITSGGQLQISGVNTGVNLSTNTWYTLQLYLSGTGSTYAITATGTTMGNTTPISLSTSVIGTPNVRLGSEFGDVNYFNGWIRYPFIYKGTLNSTAIGNMKTFLNVA